VLAAALENRAGAGRDKPKALESETEPEDDTQQEAERLRALTANIAANDPYLASRVLRAWLRETNEQSPTAASSAEAA
jgi:hypothetical protein